MPAVAFAEAGGSTSHCDNETECTEYFMDDEDVEGGVQNAGQGLIQGHRSFQRIPLIRTRVHFVDVMLKSVENL